MNEVGCFFRFIKCFIIYLEYKCFIIRLDNKCFIICLNNCLIVFYDLINFLGFDLV